MYKLLFFIFVVFFCQCCQKKQYQWTYNDGTVGLHKNFKFCDGQYIDSVFYFLYLGDDIGLQNKYVDEKIEPINLKDGNDKEAIDRFLYSLEVYNTLFWFGKKKPIHLNRNLFFKNKTFKESYIQNVDAGLIYLKNLQDLNDYNFGGYVRYDTIGLNVHIYFPPSSCELICPLEIFQEGIYFTRLDNIVIPKQRILGLHNMYLPKIEWE